MKYSFVEVLAGWAWMLSAWSEMLKFVRRVWLTLREKREY